MNKYLDRLNKIALNDKIQNTKEAEREIIKVYDMAISDIAKKLRDTGDMPSQKYLRSRINALFYELNGIVERGSIEAGETIIEKHVKTLERINKEAGTDFKFDKMFADIPTEVLKAMKGGNLYKDGLGLSSRVWNYTEENLKQIETIIYNGLSEGTGAVELAQLLETYVNPEARKYWDNAKIRELLGDGYAAANRQIEYNALRLARTCIAHSSTLANRIAANRNPFVTHFKWHSVFAHGRTCEICKERDGKIYAIKDLPFDHPNGLCWEEEIYDHDLDYYVDEIKEWIDGEDKPDIQYWYENYYKQ